MSYGKVVQIRGDGGFKKLDIAVYVVIAVIIAALFLSIFLTRDDGELTGVCIYVKNEAVFACDFKSGQTEVLSDCATAVEDGEKIYVRIETDGGYNVVEIDMFVREARMIEADCLGKRCVHTPTVSGRTTMISCSPHGVHIMPYDFEVSDDGYILF